MSMISFEDLLTLNDYRGIRRSMYISMQNKFIYFSAPKCGSTTTKNTIIRAEAESNNRTVPDVYGVHSNWLPMYSVKEIGKSAFIAVLNSDNYRKFTFVRNPYARVLSAYLSKIVAPPLPNDFYSPKTSLYRKVGLDQNREISFLEFLQIISDLSDFEKNEHWRPLTQQVFLKYISYDFIGRLESINEDLNRILSTIYGRPVGPYFLSRITTNANEKLSDYYCPASRKLVVQIYEEDFTNFGYSKDFPD